MTTLFHGTSSALAFTSLRPGSYATNSYEVALSYALEKAEELGGEPVVHLVEMDVTKLVREEPAVVYEADSHYNHEMGFQAWTNNVPVPLGPRVEKP